MTQIADPRWDEYARLQHMLSARRIVDDTSSGIEAALAVLISTISPGVADEDPIVLAQRTLNSVMRGQRRRRSLLAREAGHLQDLSRAEPAGRAEAALNARVEVLRIFDVVTAADRSVVVGLAGGGDVAANLGLAPAAFRKRLQRLRARLAA